MIPRWPRKLPLICQTGTDKFDPWGDIVKRNHENQKGFSLIELLIVVAIILIIAAIAIPNLLRARISANEASAASSIRTINTGEISFFSTYPTQGFSVLLALLV